MENQVKFTLRISQEERDIVAKSAKENDRSINSEIKQLIKNSKK